MMFRKILVAYDHSRESDRALEAGIELAKLYGVDLYSITVMEELPSYVTMSYPDLPCDSRVMESLDSKREAFYADLCKDAVQKALSEGVTLHVSVVQGSESESIIQQAKEISADLLLIGKHPHSALVDHLWGSTGQRLAWAAPCSVLAVR